MSRKAQLFYYFVTKERSTHSIDFSGFCLSRLNAINTAGN